MEAEGDFILIFWSRKRTSASCQYTWQNIRHLCWTKLAKKGHLWADLLPKVKLDKRRGEWVRNRRTVSQELKVTLLHSKIVIFVKKHWTGKTSTIMARYLIEICVWLLIEWKVTYPYDPWYNCSWLSRAGGVGWYAQLKRALTLLETAIWTLQVWWNGFDSPLEAMRCSRVIEMEAWWWSKPSKA